MKRTPAPRRFQVGRALMCLLVCARVSLPGNARAEPTPEEKARATTLFHEAKELLGSNRVADACRKLEESERLDPGGGTLLNLAVCHEREGRTATAFADFVEARAEAERDQRIDRVELADQHMSALSLHLSKLVVSVPPDVDRPGLAITLDGHPLARAAWGTPLPVDPEVHVIVASAPGKKSWSARVEIAPDLALKTVAVPPWQEIEPLPTPPSPPIVTSVEAAPPPPQHTELTPQPPSSWMSTRAPALISGTVGVVGVGMGAYFGGLAISRHDKSNAACPQDPCSSTSVDYNNSAKTAADISTVTFSVGLVGLAVGTYLWFSHGEKAEPPRVSIAPHVEPKRATLDIAGHF